MDFTFFYNKRQLKGFLNSRFASTILWSGTNKKTNNVTESRRDGNITLSPQLENILEQIEATKKLVDPVIEQYLESVEDKSILQILKYSNGVSSWREKSFLMRTSVLALEREFTKPLIKAACAIELLGMSFCLVDDIIDETSFYDLKRTMWSKYGYKETICANEILSSLAAKVLIDSCCETQINIKAFEQIMRVFQTIKQDAYISQFMDVESEKISEFSEDCYFEMTSRFPGTLYGGAIEIACLLSGINDDQVEKMKKFGRLLGMANQIRDDLIEIIGEEEAIAKKVGADILQKKKRLPLILFLQHNGKYARLFQDLDLNEKHLQIILSEIRNSDTVNVCIDHMTKLVERALFQVNSLKKSQWQELLKTLALYLAKFNKAE